MIHSNKTEYNHNLNQTRIYSWFDNINIAQRGAGRTYLVPSEPLFLQKEATAQQAGSEFESTFAKLADHLQGRGQCGENYFQFAEAEGQFYLRTVPFQCKPPSMTSSNLALFSTTCTQSVSTFYHLVMP